MSELLHNVRFHGETSEYRDARNELLKKELELRQQMEKIAALRRSLPLGGKIKEDYVFEETTVGSSGKETIRQTKLSELFENNKNSLLIYSFMYGPEMSDPCPSCSSFIDSMNGSASHLLQRINLVIVAKSPISRITQWAKNRQWNSLRILSSEKNTYNKDYFAETPEGNQIPAINVFVKKDDNSQIHHFWNAEMLHVAMDEEDPRHADLLWPIWNFFDLTPEGRGDFYPRLSYDKVIEIDKKKSQ